MLFDSIAEVHVLWLIGDRYPAQRHVCKKIGKIFSKWFVLTQ